MRERLTDEQMHKTFAELRESGEFDAVLAKLPDKQR